MNYQEKAINARLSRQIQGSVGSKKKEESKPVICLRKSRTLVMQRCNRNVIVFIRKSYTNFRNVVVLLKCLKINLGSCLGCPGCVLLSSPDLVRFKNPKGRRVFGKRGGKGGSRLLTKTLTPEIHNECKT